MISNSKCFAMGREALKGFRLKAAGLTVFAYAFFIAAAVAIYLLYVALFPAEEPTLVSTIASFFFDLVLNIVIYTMSIGAFAYFYDIYKHRTSSFARFFAGFKNFSRNVGVLFIGTVVITAISSITSGVFEIMNKNFSFEENPGIYSIIACIMAIIFCYAGYKLLPTWTGLLVKMANDNSTGAIELIKQTYHQVSKYNYKYLCFMFRASIWCILGVITFGIGFLWVLPLIAISTVVFFDAIFNPEDYAAPASPLD